MGIWLFPVLSLLFMFLGVTQRKKSYESLPEGLKRFFEHTGYHQVGLEHLTHAEQMQVALAYASGRAGPEVPRVRGYARELAGDRLVYYSRAFAPDEHGGAPLGQAAWVLYLREPARLLWSLRARGGLLSYEWGARWAPGAPPVDLDEPRLRARFKAFTADPEALHRVLAAPGLADMLLACADLDLHVLPDRILFMDPRFKNLTAMSGGRVAQMLLVSHYGRQFDLVALAHQRVAELLAEVAAATREVA